MLAWLIPVGEVCPWHHGGTAGLNRFRTEHVSEEGRCVLFKSIGLPQLPYSGKFYNIAIHYNVVYTVRVT